MTGKPCGSTDADSVELVGELPAERDRDRDRTGSGCGDRCRKPLPFRIVFEMLGIQRARRSPEAMLRKQKLLLPLRR